MIPVNKFETMKKKSLYKIIVKTEYNANNKEYYVLANDYCDAITTFKKNKHISNNRIALCKLVDTDADYSNLYVQMGKL